jgi:hypothetical protein
VLRQHHEQQQVHQAQHRQDIAKRFHSHYPKVVIISHGRRADWPARCPPSAFFIASVNLSGLRQGVYGISALIFWQQEKYSH